jgi:hypothetical protein
MCRGNDPTHKQKKKKKKKKNNKLKRMTFTSMVHVISHARKITE